MQGNAERNEAADAVERSGGRELRWIADAYEQAQRTRIQTGERIRAVVQERDETWEVETELPGDADELLKQIRQGLTDGPVPLLGRTFRRHWEAEQELAEAMKQSLQQHPAWPWLERVRGVGPTLAGKLVARLDATKADTPSAFWAYCGLATVPGTEYRCAECGYVAAYPVSYRVSGTHMRLGSSRKCTGALEVSRGPEEGVRVAQPKPARGERASYDQYAKTVCYLIGASFLKSGGAYADYYRREKAKLERDRPGWPAARRHLTALRKTEKLFLSHLWLVWREALVLPLTEPYAHAVQDHESLIDPWAMVAGADASLPPTPPPILAPQPPSAPKLNTSPARRAIRRRLTASSDQPNRTRNPI